MSGVIQAKWLKLGEGNMKGLFLLVLFLGLVSWGEDDEVNSGGTDSQGVSSVENKDQEVKVQGAVDWFRHEVEFVRIKAGWFMMGSPANELNRQDDENGKDGKRVRVDISKDFEMMSHEMTQALYERVMKENPSFFKRRGDCDNWDSIKKMCPDNPVDRVSWDDTQDFIKELNASVGLKGCKGKPEDPTGCYRLPTEAEWEYAVRAVRAGSETAYFYGDDPLQIGRYAIYAGNSGGRTHVVKGDRLPNRNGLYDTSGSVWEWVQDVYDDELPGGKDPLVTSSGWFNKSLHVLRGGSWFDEAKCLRSAFRLRYPPGDGYDGFGFRLVRTL